MLYSKRRWTVYLCLRYLSPESLVLRIVCTDCGIQKQFVGCRPWFQLTGKGILVGCARMVRYFYAPALAHGIVVKVDIGAFVEAMMWGLLGRWGDVVMDVCKAI